MLWFGNCEGKYASKAVKQRNLVVGSFFCAPSSIFTSNTMSQQSIAWGLEGVGWVWSYLGSDIPHVVQTKKGNRVCSKKTGFSGVIVNSAESQALWERPLLGSLDEIKWNCRHWMWVESSAFIQWRKVEHRYLKARGFSFLKHQLRFYFKSRNKLPSVPKACSGLQVFTTGHK